MTLVQYMHERFLHGHILNNNIEEATQLTELDQNGNIQNIFNYIENQVPDSNKIKIIPIDNPKKIIQYKYAMMVGEDLYMFLFIYHGIWYNYTYKLYDLSSELFMWFDLNRITLLDEFNGVGNYAHNRLFRLIINHNPPFIGQYAQQQFQNMKNQFNMSLQQYIKKNDILNDIISVPIEQSILITTDNSDSQHHLINLNTNKQFNVSNSAYKYFSKVPINWYINSYKDNIYILHTNYFYILKFTNDRIYILCQFTKESFKTQEYIKWQLNYALLAHIISTKEYQYLLNNIQSIYDDFNSYIKG